MNTFISKIKTDLKESRISYTIALLFIPIAFFTYLFHEFGHYLFGEFMGTKMYIGLNISAPQSGEFVHPSHALWSSIGGPTFTILQAFTFLIILRFTKSILAYSFVFFAVFSRFYSIVFGGLSLQDESYIGNMLGIDSLIIAGIVLLILFLILWRASKITKMNIKGIGYFCVLSTIAILVVIGTDSLL